ncbi:SlyX family protein [Rubripirellula sp.]|jgi:uncharacterized coiled-coil protein SlyX|nr:SlyX family protein [Rubripirellula sp.]MDA9840936.1 SlyX family protein [Rubripirellula sp.]
MPADSDDRLTKLEVQLSHTQRVVEQLNEVVTEQSRQLDRVMRLVTRFEAKLDDFKYKIEEKRDLLDDKPPHY